MEYLLALAALTATCVGTFGKAHEKASSVPLYKRINLFGWTAIGLAAVTCVAQVLKSRDTRAQQEQRASLATESLFTRSVALGQLGAGVELLALHAKAGLPKAFIDQKAAELRERLDSHRQSTEARLSMWSSALPTSMSKDIENLLEAATNLAPSLQSGRWSAEALTAEGTRLQEAAVALDTKLCAQSNGKMFPLKNPFTFSPCSPGGREWSSAREIEEEFNRIAARL